jgi:hypothetical protein
MEDATKETRSEECRMHRPFFAEEALACNSQSEVAPGLGVKPSVYLIETALQRETVAAEYSVSCLATQAGAAAASSSRFHEGMDWGAAARKRSARQPRKERPRSPKTRCKSLDEKYFRETRTTEKEAFSASPL